MKRRAFIGSGAALIGAGALHSTGAFSSINAGRTVAVNVADDQANALLGINGADESPVEFTNNTDVNMSVDITSDDVEFNPSSFDIESDSSQIQEVEFEGEGIATIVATLGDDGSAGTITLEKSFENPLLREVAGSAVGGGNNGKYEFRLVNTGDISVEITGIRVRSIETENASADRVDNGLDIDGDELIDYLDVGEDTDIVDFSRFVQIDSDDESGIFEFNQIRSPDENGNMDTTGAIVKIDVRYIESGDDDEETYTTSITLEAE